MAKANTTLDEELYDALQPVRKGKPRYFCLITKGPDVLRLIVQKKKITDGAMNKAKSEAKGNAVINGVVVGSGTDLAFEVLDAEPSIKPVKLREFIDEQTEISSKPRWVVVTAMQDVPDEESLTETAPETGVESTPPVSDFASRARESLIGREKTIKSGLEWAAKTKSPHEGAITEAYAAAREKLAIAKTEGDFDAAVQVHDNVIGLIRKAIQESAPTKTPTPSVEVNEKDVTDELAQAIEGIKRLAQNSFANQTEVQRLAGLAKAVDSHVKANDKAQAALVLTELRTTFVRVRAEAHDALLKALEEFKNHPDAAYIANTIRAIWAWGGFDRAQKQAGLDAIAANREISDPRKDLTKAQESRAKAKLACQAWDKEVVRVAQAEEAFNKLYGPHRDVIEKAATFLYMRGLPKPVADVLREYSRPHDEFSYSRTHDGYEGATKQLDAVAKLAQKIVDTERNIGEAKQRFNEANKAIKDPFLEAKKFAQTLVTQKLNVGLTKQLVDDLTTADGLVNQKLTEFAYDDAISLLGGAQSAANAVLKFKTVYDQAKQTTLTEWTKIEPDYNFAGGMPDTSDTVVADKQAMEDSYNRLNDAFQKGDYIASANEVNPLQLAVAKVKLAREKQDREDAEYDTEWATVEDDYNAVKNLGGRDKKVQVLVDALVKAYDEMKKPYDDYDSVTAKAKIPAVRAAIQPLLIEHPKQQAEWSKALKKVASIEKKWRAATDVSDTLKQRSAECNTIWLDAHKLADEGDFLGGKARLVDFVKAYDVYAKAVAAHDKVADPKAKQARKDIESLAKKGQLKGKSVADKRAFLADLRGTTEMSKDERKAQRLIYASLDLDDDFLKEDKKKRRVVASKLTDTKEKRDELRDFRNNWTKKSLEERLAVVTKALQAQCEAMGFGDDPPEIVTYDKAGANKLIDDGFFRPSDGKIYLNTNPAASLSKDLAETLDLIFHENSHNYQQRLVNRLDPSSTDPLDPSDPEHDQAIMFQMNKGPHAYVKGEEDFDDYKKQPLEEHAHDNGPKTAKAVLDNLRTKKKSK